MMSWIPIDNHCAKYDHPWSKIKEVFCVVNKRQLALKKHGYNKLTDDLRL